MPQDASERYIVATLLRAAAAAFVLINSVPFLIIVFYFKFRQSKVICHEVAKQ